MKPKLSSSLPLSTAAAVALLTLSASAVTWQWDGGHILQPGDLPGNWQDNDNWNPDTGNPNFGNGPSGVGGVGTFPDRLNVNGAQALIYTSAEGTTNYGTTGIRGLVIGSGGLGSGTMTITGGTFSTLNAGTQDAIGNNDGNTGILNIDGGTFIGSAAGTNLGLGTGSNRTSTLNVNSGSATITNLVFQAINSTVNLNLGGELSVNSMYEYGVGSDNPGSTMNFNGGTLKARQATSTFISNIDNVFVKNGGAIIDSDFAITIVKALLTDTGSTGGGLTKKGSGLLTLAAPSTITGAVTVEAGGLGVKAGTTSWAPSEFTHSGDTLNFNLGGYVVTDPPTPVINVATLTLNTAITVNLSGSNIPVAGKIIILDYGTKTGEGSLTLNTATLPVGVSAELKEDTVDGYYYLDTTPPSGVFAWSGDPNPNGTGDWDFSSLNWNTNTVLYAEPGEVTFPDIAGGGTVTLTADVAPGSFSISNTPANPYSFAGTGKITGATGITQNGTGIAKFNGAAHSYSGAVAINAGAIIKQAADDTTGGITVAADNVSFVLDGGITDGTGQTLTLSGQGVTGADYFFPGSAAFRGALQAHNGANTWEGNIVLASTGVNRIGVQNGASLTLTGMISESVAGAPLLFRAGASGHDITLDGAGTYAYTGGTQIYSNGGAIILGADNKLPTASSLYFGPGANTSVFDLNGNDQEVANISGDNDATIKNNGIEPSILTTNPAAGNSTYDGRIADGSNILSLVKKGAGTQTLTGVISYTGNTTVEDGTLSVSQSTFADSSTVTIGTAEGSAAVLNLPNAGTDIVTALVIDGVSQPGDGAIYDSTDFGGATITGAGKIQVGGSAYDAWKNANAPGSNPDDDTDGDGVDNAVEFVLGGTSATKDLDKLPVGATSGTNLTFTFKRDQDSIDPKTALFIETSTDLVTWNTPPSPYSVPDVVTVGPPVTVTDNLDGTDTITLTVPQAPDDKKFARLKVIITP